MAPAAIAVDDEIAVDSLYDLGHALALIADYVGNRHKADAKEACGPS